MTAGGEYLLTVTKAGTGTGIVLGDGINCGNDCSERYADGMVVNLEAVPDTGSVFVEWRVDQTPVSGIVGIDRDVTITAVFTEEPL
jgi:hypothetical protein